MGHFWGSITIGSTFYLLEEGILSKSRYKGGKIDLKDETNVKVISNRHLSKKQSDKIKLFARKSYK